MPRHANASRGLSLALVLGACLAPITLVGCGTTTLVTTRPIPSPLGTASTRTTSDASAVMTTDTEFRDIETTSRDMADSLLNHAFLMNRDDPARILIDHEGFRNLSSSPVNTRMLANRLNAELMRAAAGRLRFVSNRFDDVVDDVRTQTRSGGYDTGSMGLSPTRLAPDYILLCEITNMRGASESGLVSNAVEFTFYLVDGQTREQVWVDRYDFMKEGRNSVLFR